MSESEKDRHLRYALVYMQMMQSIVERALNGDIPKHVELRMSASNREAWAKGWRGLGDEANFHAFALERLDADGFEVELKGPFECDERDH